MDIFVWNIPDRANATSLKKFFLEHLKPFGIDVVACRKLKKRGCGLVTTLDATKAQRFLNVHGKPMQGSVASAQTRALRYMGRDIVCKPSYSKPGETFLRTLRQEARDIRNYKQETSYDTSLTQKLERQFQYTSIQCGIWEYEGSHLIFIPLLSNQRRGTIKFGRRHLALVSDSDSTGLELYQLGFAYTSIYSITMSSGDKPSITLTLYEAPRAIYKTNSGLHSALGGLSLRGGSGTKPEQIRVSSLWEKENLTGWSFVYRIEILDPEAMSSIDKLLQWGHEMPASIRWPTIVSNLKPSIGMDGWIAALDRNHVLDFRVKFQLQMLAQNGVLNPVSLLQLLPHITQLFHGSGGFAATEAVRNLFKQVPFAGPDTEAGAFGIDTIKDQLQKSEKTSRREEAHRSYFKQNHPHIVFVHRAIVTPAGFYLRGPEPECSNRVLRTYRNYIDHFIRVTFCEEDWDQVRFDPSVSLHEIFHSRFKNVLDHGFQIAERRFAFLGFSHSSLRDQTCWFMAPFDHEGVLLDANNIIAKLGDFSSIRSPARCAARIGQAFSTTDGAIKIPPRIIQEIPDIERNGRVFSDGVGTISADVLALIWRDYFPARKSRPTLYQIRLAGAKGMISLDTRLSGEVLSLRQSMIKFLGSKTFDIEICGSATRPLPMYLNRSLIKIMEDLGVAPGTLIQLQNDAVENLRQSTLSAANAANFLERENLGKVSRIPWLIRKLHSIGFDFLEDPFLRRVLELAILSQLRELKHRSRIFVKHGTTLYGIMDESGTLAEGEIYCSVEKTVVVGKVAVTRAPAMHPGDIQLATAVDMPKGSPLSHLHNCVVFSQRGLRDLPSQLSGGDLDGDLYNIIYDPGLVPPRVVDPADYPRTVPKDIGREVTRKDMTDFFIDFMENDQLGRIAMLHMQLADRPGGTQHPDCKRLSELHSTAVDFSKTGIRVDLSKMPKNDRCRPDFMAPSPRLKIEKWSWDLAKSPPPNIAEAEEEAAEEEAAQALDPDTPSYRYYESENVLGRLYRAIDERGFLLELQQRARDLEAMSHSNKSIIHRLWVYVQRETYGIQWEHYREWAHNIKEAYENQVVETIHQYSSQSALITELEVFVGTLLGKNGGLRNSRIRELSTSMKESFERDIAFTISCIVQGLDDPYGCGQAEALERSIACLAVAVQEPSGTWGKVKRLESFRYVAAVVCLGQLQQFNGNLAST